MVKINRKDKDSKKWLNAFILLVVGLVIMGYAFLSSESESLNESSDNLPTEYNPYPEKVDKIERFLVEKGYEVIYVSALNLSKNAPFLDWYNIEDNTICQPSERFCKTNKIHILVTMKSWGSRSAQIESALLSSNVEFPNAFVYTVNIQSPTDACNYVVFGNTYRNYVNELDACFSDKWGDLNLNEDCFDSEGNWKIDAKNRLNQLEAQVDAEIERYKQCS